MPQPGAAGMWVGVIFGFFYNKLYIKGLVKKGFQAYGVDHGDLTELVNKVDSSIPILEEPQTNPKPQEPEPKKENSTEDKLKELNALKEKDLIFFPTYSYREILGISNSECLFITSKSRKDNLNLKDTFRVDDIESFELH